MSSSSCASPTLAASSPQRLDPTLVFTVSFTVMAWASSFPAIRAGLAGFGPAEMAALRFALAGAPAALFLIATRAKLPELGDIWRFLVGGVIFIAGYALLLNFGQRVVPAGPPPLPINNHPVTTAPLAPVVLGGPLRPTPRPRTPPPFAPPRPLPPGQGAPRAHRRRHKPLHVAAWNMAIGGFGLLPFLPSAIEQAQVAPTISFWSVVYLAVVPSLIAYGTWAITLSRLPAARASNFQYAVPPMAMLIGFLWLGEIPAVFGLIGGAMALAGVVVVNLKR